MTAGEVTVRWIESPGDAEAASMARVLHDAMRAFPVSYGSEDEALAEVRTFRRDDRVAVGAESGGAMLGWGGLVMHGPHAWELHPLCVSPAAQGRGVGGMIVGALEARARGAGVTTMWLGTEDEVGATTLFGVDLYPEVASKLAGMRVLRPHPISFYRALGFEVSGVIPDASGPGRHDFIMSKRLA